MARTQMSLQASAVNGGRVGAAGGGEAVGGAVPEAAGGVAGVGACAKTEPSRQHSIQTIKRARRIGSVLRQTNPRIPEEGARDKVARHRHVIEYVADVCLWQILLQKWAMAMARRL